MSHPDDIKQAPSHFVNALRQFTTLVQDEIALMRVELSTSLSKAGTGLAMIGVAALTALVALNTLAAAFVDYLAMSGMSIGTAALIVAGVLFTVAIGLVMVGKSRLKPEALMPERTAENIKRDVAHIKEATDV
ncbi:phage holin family protein [Dinoroseobacter sp. S124A]|uniref:phage holin family protein n=1 Tax=Dinoroseobacter sp. S124A TaxID=3415128 RepID=UPI003C7BB2CD